MANLMLGRYNLIRPTVSDTKTSEIQVDNEGRILTVTSLAATTKYSTDISAALEASSVSKASAGTLYKGNIRIDSTAASTTYYLHIGNHASLPADGAVTLLVAPIKKIHTTGTDSYIDFDFTGDAITSGVTASTGITWWISTTEFTKTIAGAVASGTIFYT